MNVLRHARKNPDYRRFGIRVRKKGVPSENIEEYLACAVIEYM